MYGLLLHRGEEVTPFFSKLPISAHYCGEDLPRARGSWGQFPPQSEVLKTLTLIFRENVLATRVFAVYQK